MEANNWSNIFEDKIFNFLNTFIDAEKLDIWRVVFLVVGLFLSVLIAKFARWLLERKALKLAEKTESKLDDIFCVSIGKPFALLLFSAGFYISAFPIVSLLEDFPRKIFDRFCLSIAASAIAWALYRLVDILEHLMLRLAEKHQVGIDNMIIPIIRKALRVLIFVLSVIFIGQNILCLNVTAILAGAGVAGLAISFGAQNTVSNFFSSIMIIVDQPFKLGDRVVIDKFDGVVENIGFRTTKLRTLAGNLVTIPNSIVANSSIENISRRPAIVFSANIALVYSTPPEKMREALAILNEIFANHECMSPEKPPRIFFNEFKDWSLNIMIKAWFHSNDYWQFMEWQQKVNMQILERFNAAGLDFAFPTNTTYLKRLN